MKTAITIADPEVKINVNSMIHYRDTPVAHVEIINGPDAVSLTFHADVWQTLIDQLQPIILKHMALKMKEAQDAASN